MINTGCGFSPLYKSSNSISIFEEIRVQTDQTLLSFLIEEALEEKANFKETAFVTLNIEPDVKTSYGVITKENEITRYSVTLKVDYSLYNNKTREYILKDSVSSTSDYSAAVTYSGFATEIARNDTYERLSNAVAEKISTEILIKFSNGFSS